MWVFGALQNTFVQCGLVWEEHLNIRISFFEFQAKCLHSWLRTLSVSSTANVTSSFLSVNKEFSITVYVRCVFWVMVTNFLGSSWLILYRNKCCYPFQHFLDVHCVPHDHSLLTNFSCTGLFKKKYTLSKIYITSTIEHMVMCYKDWWENSQKLFSYLTSTRCEPHVWRGRCQIDNPLLPALVTACHR
jgi:hypothetical protein